MRPPSPFTKRTQTFGDWRGVSLAVDACFQSFQVRDATQPCSEVRSSPVDASQRGFGVDRNTDGADEFQVHDVAVAIDEDAGLERLPTHAQDRGNESASGPNDFTERFGVVVDGVDGVPPRCKEHLVGNETVPHRLGPCQDGVYGNLSADIVTRQLVARKDGTPLHVPFGTGGEAAYTSHKVIGSTNHCGTVLYGWSRPCS